jgi:hypothetical protein
MPYAAVCEDRNIKTVPGNRIYTADIILVPKTFRLPGVKPLYKVVTAFLAEFISVKRTFQHCPYCIRML